MGLCEAADTRAGLRGRGAREGRAARRGRCKHTTHTHTCGLFASLEGGIVAERPEEEQDFLQGDSTH